MSFDLQGEAPKGPAFKRLSFSAWQWRPLWTYCQHVSDVAAATGESGMFNNGTLISARDARMLASDLRRALDSQDVKRYALLYLDEQSGMPDVPCRVCNSRGVVRRARAVTQAGVAVKTATCGRCKGTGRVRPIGTYYVFSEHNVRTLMDFCIGSGGFRIW